MRIQIFYLILSGARNPQKKIKNYQIKTKETVSQSYFHLIGTENLIDIPVDINLVLLVLILNMHHTEQKFLLKKIKLKHSIIVIS